MLERYLIMAAERDQTKNDNPEFRNKATQLIYDGGGT